MLSKLVDCKICYYLFQLNFYLLNILSKSEYVLENVIHYLTLIIPHHLYYDNFVRSSDLFSWQSEVTKDVT